MKKINSITLFLLTVIITAGLVFSCPDQDGMGTLVINLPGSGYARAALTSEEIDKLELSYEISLTSSSENRSINAVTGESVTLDVSAGMWNINVKVLRAGLLEIGEQTKTQNVGRGRVTPVSFNIPIKIPASYFIIKSSEKLIDNKYNIAEADDSEYSVMVFENGLITTKSNFISNKENNNYHAVGKITHREKGEPCFELKTTNGEDWAEGGEYTVVLIRNAYNNFPELLRKVDNVYFYNGNAIVNYKLIYNAYLD